MSRNLRLIAGMCGILGAAAVIGLTSNALRSDGLPLIRKPLSETRAMATREQLTADVPALSSDSANSAPQKDMPPTSVTKKPEPDAATRTAEQPQPQAKAGTGSSPQPAPQPAAGKTASQSAKPAVKKIEALFTTLQDAKGCYDNDSAIFVDARAIEDYEAEHISGAVWLCYESIDEDYERVLGHIPKDRLLITYCSDAQCASAIKLADELVARGHTRVVIMLEGLPGWKDAGYPTGTGKEAGN